MTVHRFDQRVALVTGAGSGLGYQHAVALAQLGAKIFIQDLRSQHGSMPEEKTAQEVAKELVASGFPDVDYDQGDIGDEQYCIKLVHKTVKRFGRIDILINNAGMPAYGTPQNTDTAHLLNSLRVNLLGSFWTMRTALALMREQDYGRIVNTSSGTATFGSANMFPYVTAKGGVISMTKAASLDNMDRNIKINAFCPVAYTTSAREYFNARKGIDLASLDPGLATPVALYLAHEDCAFTGETLSAGSGKWARIFSGKTNGPVRISKDVDDVFASIKDIMDHNNFTILASAQAQYD